MLAPVRTLFVALALVTVAASVPALAGDDADKPGAPPAKKDRATKDDYKIDVSGSSSEVKVGEDGVIKLVLVPKNGTKIHPQAPLEVKLSEPDGIQLEKRKLGRGDVADKAAKDPSLSTAVSGRKAGSYNVDADVSFFLCTDEWCQRMTDRVSIPVKVREPG